MALRIDHPVTTTQARSELTGTVQRFREEGAAAGPVIFGSHRKPEAVILPYEAYEAVLEIVEEFAIAERVRERDARDNGNRTSLRESAAKFGIDLDEL